jgi:hypothetical protein
MMLDDTVYQLINVSDAERKIMKDIPPNEKLPHEQQKAITITKAWADQILNPLYRPSEANRFFPITGDEKQKCDIVRCEYSVLNTNIMMSQSFCVFAIVIDRRISSDRPLIEQVTEVARTVLLEPQRIKLRITSKNEEMCIGEQESPAADSAQSDFIDNLRFWTNGKKIALFTLKKTKQPSRAMITWVKEFNLSWFSLYKKY